MLTDLEAVFRSLKSELGLRPAYHHKEELAEGHLSIGSWHTRRFRSCGKSLKTQGIVDSWTTLRETFPVQQRVTATFKQRDGRTLHVRKATVAEPKLKRLYDALGLSPSPRGVGKLVN